MRKRLLFTLGVMTAALLLLTWIPAAHAVSFAYEVDSMTIVSTDGRGINEVYDFSGSTFPDPQPENWEFFVSFGTATVGNGVLTLSDPGTFAPMVVDGTLLEMNRSDLTMAFNHTWPGEFLSTSVWIPKVPPLNEWYGYWSPCGDSQFVGVFVADFDVQFAEAVSALPSLQVIQVYATLDSLTGEWHFETESHAINASDITGPVVFEYHQDLLTWDPQFSVGTRVSIDGGASFFDFADILLQDGQQSSALVLAADPFIDIVPEPSTALLVAAGLAGLAAARRRRSRQ